MILKKIENHKLIFYDNKDNYDLEIVIYVLNKYIKDFEKFLNLDINFDIEYKMIQSRYI